MCVGRRLICVAYVVHDRLNNRCSLAIMTQTGIIGQSICKAMLGNITCTVCMYDVLHTCVLYMSYKNAGH